MRVSVPAFSVVIPARNEAAYLPGTLKALERQTLAPAEVIVVDNGSRDQTVSIAQAWGARVLHCPENGVARVRQMGLEAARSPWIASTDADTQPLAHWLEAYAAALPGHVALYGPMQFWGLSRPWDTLSGGMYSSFLHVCRLLNKPNLAGGNMAFSRAAALLAGGVSRCGSPRRRDSGPEPRPDGGASLCAAGAGRNQCAAAGQGRFAVCVAASQKYHRTYTGLFWR